jgi:hypothetical protein
LHGVEAVLPVAPFVAMVAWCTEQRQWWRWLIVGLYLPIYFWSVRPPEHAEVGGRALRRRSVQGSQAWT